MKVFKIFLYILFSIFISYNGISQDTKHIGLDTLRYYKSRVDEYKFEDTALYKKYTHRITNSIKKQQSDKFLFYAYSVLGELYRLDGLYEIALQNYFKALEYTDIADNQNEVADIYDHLIFIYRVRGETDRMFETSSKAISIRKSIADMKGIHKTKRSLANHYRKTGNYMEAFKIFYDALDYFEKQKDTSGIIMSYHNIAMTYKALGNSSKGLEIYDICDTYLNEANFQKERSTIYNGMGTIQLKMGLYQDALNNFLRSLEIENKTGNKFRILTRYNNIGIAYSYLKNFGSALENFGICIDEYRKSHRWKDLANLYNSVGMCYEEMGIPDSSIHYYLKSIELCKQYDFKELYIKSALWLSRIYDELGKMDSAYVFLRKYHELFEMIDKSNLAWEITAKEFEYMRRKDQRLKEIEKKNALLLNIIIVASWVFTIFISWIIVIKLRYRFRKSQLAKRELEKQEIELKDQINSQNKELVSKILQLNDSNSGVKLTIQKLIKLKSEMGVNSKQKIQQVINDLEHSVNNNIWDEFEHRFMKVHPLLYKKISINYPNLTITERRLCALIHLNFSSKEIANITKQSYKSILVAKSRLRNKLNINESLKTTDFFHRLVQM